MNNEGHGQSPPCAHIPLVLSRKPLGHVFLQASQKHLYQNSIISSTLKHGIIVLPQVYVGATGAITLFHARQLEITR